MFSWILLLLIGLAVGSFLNVVTLRYTPENSVFSLRNIGGRSRCPHCYNTLRWFELVPIFSFLIQKGRCRNCLKAITPQYVVVELLSALIFILVPYHFELFKNASQAQILGISPWGFYLEAMIFILAFMALMVIGAIDHKWRIIPNELNIMIAVLGVFLIVVSFYFETVFGVKSGMGMYSPLFNWHENILVNRLVGVFAGALITGLPVFISGGKVMGLGDFKLAIALGLLFGWPSVIFIFFSAFITGSIFGLGLIFAGQKKFKSLMPFAPFISSSALIIFLWGETLLKAYFNLFGI